MTDENILEILSACDWVKAKSELNPHQYIVRGKHLDFAVFSDAISHLRANGVRRGWGGKTYIVWYAPDGHHYWTMGWPIGETTIINRGGGDAFPDQTYDATPRQRYSGPEGRPPEGFDG